MMRRSKPNALWMALPLFLAVGGASCGGSSEDDEKAYAGDPAGSECTSDDQCTSGSCQDNECVAGSGLADGKSCVRGSECASGMCSKGTCGSSSSSADDDDAISPSDDDDDSTSPSDDDDDSTSPSDDDDDSSTQGAGGAIEDGTEPNASGGTDTQGGDGDTAGSTSTTPAPTTVTSGPKFEGGGEGWRPMTTGCGPSTASLCTGECERAGGEPGVSVVRAPATLCFSGEGDATPDDPSAVIEQVVEEVDGQKYVHLRVTFDPSFTDSTYGTGACCGWPEKRGHTFEDLYKSDHTELLLTNGDAETVVNFKIDLVHPDASSSCGYQTLGVTGGDGSVILGDPSYVLGVATSLSRNLNGCGYCEVEACGGDCTVNSPATDENYTPNEDAPYWDYRQVYEVWVDAAAFGDAGFGQAYITYTHSSPAKSTDTLQVEPTPCPPEWDSPYCAADDPACNNNTGTGGAGGSGGNEGSGGGPEAGAPGSGGTGQTGGDGTTDCGSNEQAFMGDDGKLVCTPIPFANYPGMAACPEGYILDTASEGEYCLPESDTAQP